MTGFAVAGTEVLQGIAECRACCYYGIEVFTDRRVRTCQGTCKSAYSLMSNSPPNLIILIPLLNEKYPRGIPYRSTGFRLEGIREAWMPYAQARDLVLNRRLERSLS